MSIFFKFKLIQLGKFFENFLHTCIRVWETRVRLEYILRLRVWSLSKKGEYQALNLDKHSFKIAHIDRKNRPHSFLFEFYNFTYEHSMIKPIKSIFPIMQFTVGLKIRFKLKFKTKIKIFSNDFIS